MAQYKQQPLNLDQQIELLQSKGLIIADVEQAKFWLSNVSYFRLKNYSYTFKDYDANGVFRNGTTFDQIIDLYLFDRDLKLIIFDAIETIEVAFKTQISNTMSDSNGSHWYLNSALFSPSFDHETFIQDLAKKCVEPEDLFIQAYNRVYDSPPLPPSWMIMEIISFGKISLIFEHLFAREQKLKICDNFKLPEGVLMSWLRCFNFIRNRCAHHSRIVYTTIKFQPIIPTRQKHTFLADFDFRRDHLYSALCCMQFLLRIINPKSQFKDNLITLLNETAGINPVNLGFSTHWAEEEIWK